MLSHRDLSLSLMSDQAVESTNTIIIRPHAYTRSQPKVRLVQLLKSVLDVGSGSGRPTFKPVDRDFAADWVSSKGGTVTVLNTG